MAEARLDLFRRNCFFRVLSGMFGDVEVRAGVLQSFEGRGFITYEAVSGRDNQALAADGICVWVDIKSVFRDLEIDDRGFEWFSAL